MSNIKAVAVQPLLMRGKTIEPGTVVELPLEKFLQLQASGVVDVPEAASARKEATAEAASFVAEAEASAAAEAERQLERARAEAEAEAAHEAEAEAAKHADEPHGHRAPPRRTRR